MTFHTTGALARIFYFLQTYEVVEAVLPFLLIFTLIFSLLQRIKLFGEDKKNINVVVALLLAIITVVPHLTGGYPFEYDPIRIINVLIPSAAVMAVAIILVLFLLGIWGFEMGGGVPAFVVLLILGILGYIFGTTVGWWTGPEQVVSWWDSDLTVAVIIILIFGVIIWFIQSDTKTGFGKILETLTKRIK